MGNYMHHCTIRWQHPKTTSTTFYFLPMYFKQGVPRTRNASFLREYINRSRKRFWIYLRFPCEKYILTLKKRDEEYEIWSGKKITTKKVSRCAFWTFLLEIFTSMIELILDYYMDRFKRNFVSTFYSRYFWRIL